MKFLQKVLNRLNESLKLANTPIGVLEKCYGPGCDPKFLGGVDPKAAHLFYHRVWVATGALQSELRQPKAAMEFLQKVLNRLNESLKPTS
jgi:hypothetical protein